MTYWIRDRGRYLTIGRWSTMFSGTVGLIAWPDTWVYTLRRCLYSAPKQAAEGIIVQVVHNAKQTSCGMMLSS